MKKNNMKGFSRRILYALLPFLLASGGLWAQQDKTINKEFANIRNINIEHRGGPLFVKPSPDGKTYVRALIAVEAATQQDAQKVLDHFDLLATEQNGQLHLKTVFEVMNSINTGGKLRLVFKDGTKVGNLRNLSLSLEVQSPELEKLQITGKYHEIRIDDGVNIRETLNIQTYEGDLQVGNIQGDFELNAKYTKGRVGNFRNSQLVLYECKLELGDGRQTDLQTKYSKLVFGSLESLKMTAYEDEIETGEIRSDVVISDKYSEIQIGGFKNGLLETYESKIYIPRVQDLQIKSKYTKWKIDRAENVHFELSYEDKAEFGQIASLTTANSKYADFNIGSLSQRLILQSYEDDVVIQRIEPTLKNIKLEGKYLNLEANLPDDLGYQLEAIMKYGKLQYPGAGADFEWLFYKEKDDNLEVKGKRKGASDNSPVISINTYEGKILFQ